MRNKRVDHFWKADPVTFAQAPKLGGDTASQLFASLRAIADIPDIGEGVLANQIPIDLVIKMRNTQDGKAFRKWFHDNCRSDPAVVAREYCKLLRDLPKSESLPARVLRFILTSAVGAIPGIGAFLGPAAGAVDSFFLQKWLRGSSPKFFIEKLSQIQAKPS
jgi:hypothetical protein